MFLMVFLVGTVSAIDWDDVKYYDEETKTYTLENFFGLGKEIGQLELKTEQNYKVPIGYQKFAEVEVRNGEYNYNEIINGITLENIRDNMKEVVRNVDYKYKTIIQVPDYETVCNDITNPNETISTNCIQVEKGTKDKVEWFDFKDNSLLIGENITLGLFTNVQKGDKIEWVLNVYGNERLTAWATWEASLNVGLQVYYNFDNITSTDTVLDEEVNHIQNGTRNNMDATNWVEGILGNALFFNGVDETVNITDASGLWNKDKTTISFWIYPITNWSAAQQIWDGQPNRNNHKMQRNWDIRRGAVDGTSLYSGGEGIDSPQVEPWALNTWHHIVFTEDKDGDNGFWIDGINRQNSTTGFTPADSSWMHFGNHFNLGTNQYLNARLDEWGNWNRTLSGAEIVQLYNGGTGITFTTDFGTAPIVTLNTPTADQNFFNNTIDFNCFASDEIAILNVSLIINGTVEQTNTSGINNSNYTFTETITTGKGLYDWTCKAYDDINLSTIPTVRNFTISNDLTITLNDPINAFNTTAPLIAFNGTASDDTAVINVSLFLDGTLNETNSSGLNNTNYSFLKTFIEGNHNWTMEVCDFFECSIAATRNFTLHLTPASVTADNPTGEINYHLLGNNLTANWTITETGQNLSAHIAECLIIYNTETINITNQCVTTNTTNITYVNGADDYTIRVTEEFGFVTTNITAWTIKLLEQNQTFTASTIEGIREDFGINYAIASGKTVTITRLWYNGTPQDGLITSLGGQNYSAITTNFLIPAIDSNINASFFWSFLYSDATQVNTTERNQTIQSIGIDDCSIHSNLIFNYTILGEESQVKLLNTSFELLINILDLERENFILNFSQDYTSTNPAAVCLNISLTNDTRYSLDSTAKYSSNQTGTSGHAIEYYNILNFTLANNTVDPVISLFDLLLDDSTDFQLTFKNENLESAPNVLVLVNRQYVGENTFKTVEIPLTDSNGQTILHLVRNDIVYNFIMVDIAGNILATFNHVTAFCDDFTIGRCTLRLNADRGEDTLYNVTTDVGINYDTSYSNSTKILSLNFISVDLTAQKVTLEVIRNTDFGNRTACSEDLTSSSGTIQCDLSGVSERFLFVNILVNDKFKGTEGLDTEQTEGGAYGVEGYFMAFLLILLLITIFSDNKPALLISLIFGWVLILAFSLIKGGLFGTASAGIWLVISVILMLTKLRKERI